jgi:thiosulfate dehydrogenase
MVKIALLFFVIVVGLTAFLTWSWQTSGPREARAWLVGNVWAESSPGAATSSEAKGEPLVVTLCDGETELEVEGLREGGIIPPERAPEVARQMMAAQQAKQASKWTARDQLIWEREQKRVVEEGDRLFHDWKALGGTIGISCDMCHPNASNTHPETYPKFQTQLKKVVGLRDIINWCIENPMKGKPLALDDPRMLAVEAYITSTRKGVPLDPGKH